MPRTVRVKPGVIRCSDADRERVGVRLRDAASEGRLSMDEFEERLAAAYATTYQHELGALTADLPRPVATRIGWPAIVGLLWAQLRADLATRRRLVLAVTALVMVLIVGSAIVGAFHGYGGDGHGIGPGGAELHEPVGE
ncbi:hypothetical protein L3i22_043310 [Actinoplanes sp. L3-i22]|nr:hypothetical protein L3i22_043310 [Actinoplanes sp. L3-i22]